MHAATPRSVRRVRGAVLCLVAILAAAGAAAMPAPPLPEDSVYQLRLGLTDQDGRAWDWGSRRGKPQVVAMFYTSCQHTCPLIVDSGKAVEHALTPAERDRLGILLISMDPEHDTPPALMAVVEKRKLDTTRWALASPRPDAVRGVAGVLGVRYRALADGQFSHSNGLVLLDRQGRIVARTGRIGSDLDPAFIAAVRRQLR